MSSERELIRFPNWLRVTEAQVAAGQEYWFLKKVEYQDDTLSGGLHHIFVQEPHDAGLNATVSSGADTWAIRLEKPAGEPAGNFPMYGGLTYSCEMAGLPSDRLEGMHMPSKHHVNYKLTYEKRRKTQPMSNPTGGTGTTGGSTGGTGNTGGGTTGDGSTMGNIPRSLPQSLISRGDAAQVLQFNKRAALQKVIFRDDFVPNSPEFLLIHEGKQYLGQRSENLTTGEVRVYYCEVGDYDDVSYVVK